MMVVKVPEGALKEASSVEAPGAKPDKSPRSTSRWIPLRRLRRLPGSIDWPRLLLPFRCQIDIAEHCNKEPQEEQIDECETARSNGGCRLDALRTGCLSMHDRSFGVER